MGIEEDSLLFLCGWNPLFQLVGFGVAFEVHRMPAVVHSLQNADNWYYPSSHRKRVPFSVNLPVCAMACRTDFACWEVSQTLLKILSLPTTPQRTVLMEFWEKFFKKFSLFLNTGKFGKCQCIRKKFLKIFLIGVDCCILINTCLKTARYMKSGMKYPAIMREISGAVH